MNIPDYLDKKRQVILTEKDLIAFEEKVKKYYEDAKITAPVHLSKGNEKELLEIFQYVDSDDWVFSSWRSHYHALLHGLSQNILMDDIIEGRSMSINSIKPKFYSSSIVAGIIPIAVGVAKALKLKRSEKRA